MERKISISEFIPFIKRLPSDEPVVSPRVWYKTQNEHWLGWLGGYKGPGAYGRKTGVKRNARFAYNHVVNPQLLMYLIRAIQLRAELVEAAERAYESGSSQMEKSGAIRKAVPWSENYKAIWGKEKLSLARRVGNIFRQGLGKQRKNLGDDIHGDERADTVSCEPLPVQNRALSVRQPYAEQILLGTKKIEYRSTVTNIRGWVYVYASQTSDLNAFRDLKIQPGSLPTGVIVGTVEIVGCSINNGEYEWHLTHPERMEQPVKPENHPQPIWFKPFQENA